MVVLGLDLATVTGFAQGPAGGAPVSGTVRLKGCGDEPETAAFNILAFLRDRFTFDRPDLVCVEHWLAPKAMKGQDAMILQLMVHGVVAAVCRSHSVRLESVAIHAWRKHFLGSAMHGGRDEAKRAAIQRCIALRYLPHGARDDNQADALGIWDYAAATFGGRKPAALVMFGEAAAS